MNFAQAGIPKKLYNYIIVLFLITLFLRIVLIGYYNNNLGGIETNVVYGIQRILLGQPLYQDPGSNTYAVIQYTPLYYCFTAAIAKLTRINGLDVQGIYTICRILAIAFNLLTIVIVALIIRTWKFSWWQSFVFALPVLIILTSHYYTRGDSMHLFFFTAALYSYILYSKKEKLQYIIITAFLSAACFMAKQSGILVIGIIGAFLLFSERKYLMAVLYTVSTVIFACIIAWLCINGAWEAFYQNAYLGLKNGTDFSFLYNIFISQFYTDMVLCYILGGIIAYSAIKEIRDKPFRILAAGVALSWLFAVVTGLKNGSCNNYFIEFLLLVIITLPRILQSPVSNNVLARIFGHSVTIHRFACIALFILVSSKTAGFFTAVYIDKNIKNNSAEYANEKALYDYFKNELKIKKHEHILFTERNFLDNIFIEYSIMPTKDVVSETYLANNTTFNYSAFASGMNNGLIKYIVTDEKKKDMNRWNKEIPFMLFDKNKFRWLGDKCGYSIYVYTPG